MDHSIFLHSYVWNSSYEISDEMKNGKFITYS